MNEPIKVYGEDLYNGGTSEEVIGGGTMQALVVNIFATKTKSYSAATVTVKAADAKGGSYEDVVTSKEISGSYNEGDLLASLSLPFDVKNWLKAESTDTDVRVTLGYLPR